MDDATTRRYPEPGDEPEVELPRGDVTEGVVRVGSTVRRPAQPQSAAVADYLGHLERAGFDGAPRFLGRDDRGRDVLTFLDGDVAGDPPDPRFADDGLLVSVAGLVRRLHDASEGYLASSGLRAPHGAVWARDQVHVASPHPDPSFELVGHNDVTPQNVVTRGGAAVALVDFDLAGPTTRLLDATNTAMWWVPLRPPADVPAGWADLDRPRRLRLFADAYGLTADQRAELVGLAVVRAEVSWLTMRARALTLGGGWARMWEAGVGESIVRRREWLRDNATALTHALLA